MLNKVFVALCAAIIIVVGSPMAAIAAEPNLLAESADVPLVLGVTGTGVLAFGIILLVVRILSRRRLHGRHVQD